MKVHRSQLEKITICDVPRLDPIEVFLEDTGPGRGSLTVSCYNQSWVARWNAMGEKTPVAEFVTKVDTDYLVGCLAPGLRQRTFNRDILIQDLRREIIQRRRGGSHNLGPLSNLEADEARHLYDRVPDEVYEHEDESIVCPDLMEEVFGSDWWNLSDLGQGPNPKYEYLAHIVQTLRQALCEESQPIVA